MKSRKMFAVILGALMMTSSVSVMAKGPIKVTINDEQVTLKEVKPFIDSNDRILVPLRFISETLGAEVKWDKAAQKVTVIYGGKEVGLTVGQSKMTVNGMVQTIDTKPVMKNGSVFVPIKYIGEVLGVEAKWLANDSTLAITAAISGDTVVAKVNDLTVTAKEVLAQLNYEMMMMQYQYQYDASNFETEEGKAVIKQRKGELVDYIINNKIALLKGKELKMEPTAAEIDTQVNKIKSGYQTEDGFKKALEEAGLTEETYRQQISDNLTVTNVMDSITKKITATDAELKAYYEANTKDYVIAPGAKMYHILVATEDEAKAVKAESDKGTSFEELAKKYGTDGTKDKGGALGYVEYESRSYDQDFLNGAKKLEEGQVSDPVKTQFGWHLIKVTDVHKEVYTTPLEEVKEEVKQGVIASKATPTIYSQLEAWGKEMTIEKDEDAISKL